MKNLAQPLALSQPRPQTRGSHESETELCPRRRSAESQKSAVSCGGGHPGKQATRNPNTAKKIVLLGVLAGCFVIINKKNVVNSNFSLLVGRPAVAHDTSTASTLLGARSHTFSTNVVSISGYFHFNTK